MIIDTAASSYFWSQLRGNRSLDRNGSMGMVYSELRDFSSVKVFFMPVSGTDLLKVAKIWNRTWKKRL